MDRKIDFTKSAFAHYLANLIILSLGLWRLTLSQECQPNLLLNFLEVPAARRLVRVGKG